MINQKIENIVNFIREARDEAENFGEHILLFLSLMLIGTVAIFFAFVLCMLVFTEPKVFIGS